MGQDEHQDDKHEAFYKEWRGRPDIRAKLSGPFYGMDLLSPLEAEMFDGALRLEGALSLRYHGTYVIASAGPEHADTLYEVFKGVAQNWASKGWPKEPKIYVAPRQDSCIEAVFQGEGLTLAPGYEGRYV